MKNISRLLLLILFSVALNSPLHAQTQTPASTPALGVIVIAKQASIGDAGATAGSSIYSGDYLSTADDGALQLRVGALMIQLEPSSSLHIYRAPYGAVVELNRGTLIYTTPGGRENLVIVASDVRVTPDATLADTGRVSIDNPCEISVYSQRGQASVLSGRESRTIEEGKAYHVRAEKKITYREYLSPDATDYHRYHEHEPCAAADMADNQRPPLAANTGHFEIVAMAGVAALSGIAISKAIESPSKP